MEKAKVTAKIEGLSFRWYGGHGVHIYEHGEETDFFSVGDFAKDEATKKEVIRGIEQWASDTFGYKIKLHEHRGDYE